MKPKRIHYAPRGARVQGSWFSTACGRRGVACAGHIPEITCRPCLKVLWQQISLAHFRAFGAGATDFGRRMRRAMREAEGATRGAKATTKRRR